MWLNLKKIFDQLSTDPSVRAIVLSGAGPKGFTAGLDVTAASQSGPLSANSSSDPSRTARHVREHILDFQACITAVEACSKPVVCALHGIVFGLGIDLSCAADVRLASGDARFSVKEVDIGIAADIGTLSRLPKAVGSFSWVKEVCLSAREWNAAEAERVGYVSSVVQGGREQVVGKAVELAGLIASKSPVAVWGTKELLNYSRDRGVEEGLRYTAVWNSAMLQSGDVKSALLSGIQKKKAKFEKL
jgi:delta(3,5)-delta(2,4)-dienoyl-CoA isomerase